MRSTIVLAAGGSGSVIVSNNSMISVHASLSFLIVLNLLRVFLLPYFSVRLFSREIHISVLPLFSIHQSWAAGWSLSGVTWPFILLFPFLLAILCFESGHSTFCHIFMNLVTYMLCGRQEVLEAAFWIQRSWARMRIISSEMDVNSRIDIQADRGGWTCSEDVSCSCYANASASWNQLVRAPVMALELHKPDASSKFSNSSTDVHGLPSIYHPLSSCNGEREHYDHRGLKINGAVSIK